MGYFVGADTGGTFTDLVVISETGDVWFDKAFSTPHDPSRGVIDALGNGASLLGIGVTDLTAQTLRFTHGTTVGTNALIQRKGAKVALLTTQGFEDTTLITRGPMGMNLGIPAVQALDYANSKRPAPIVPAGLIRGVAERIAATGEVITPIDESAVGEVLRELLAEEPESLAVSLLWSFRHSAHEKTVKRIIGELAPAMHVSISSEVAPVLGEFERTMTTVVNAYVGPVIDRYISNLRSSLTEMSMRSSLQILKSSGGVTLPERVEREAVGLINSGPIGGLVAARYLGGILGYKNIITSDVGGTSFDVGLIRDGEFEYEQTPALDQGVPAQTPAVKVVTVGAGGGSIAWTDGRRLHVGPQSAGSNPGPACYGVGEDPTVTDALVVLGIIDPANFFGGRKRLDKQRAIDAIRIAAAEPLGLTVEEAAAGIYEIVTARMSDLVRKVTVESGYDPRDFALLAYGGAGPAHAALYSAALGVKELVVPFTSSVFSAFGCALSDIRFSFVRSEPMVLGSAESADRYDAVFEELEAQALAEFAASGQNAEGIIIVRRVDARYTGQLNEMSILCSNSLLADAGIDSIRTLFEEQYESRFGAGTTSPGVPLEIITFRVDVIQETSKPELNELPLAGEDAGNCLTGTREIYLKATGAITASIYDGDRLAPGNRIDGPAVIERRDTTILIPPGHGALIDGYRNVRIKEAAE